MNRVRSEQLRLKLGRHRVFEAQGKLAVAGLLLLAFIQIVITALVMRAIVI